MIKQLNIPFSGLHLPLGTFDPQLANGKLSTCDNWIVRQDSIYLAPGRATTYSGVGYPPLMMYPYVNVSKQACILWAAAASASTTVLYSYNLSTTNNSTIATLDAAAALTNRFPVTRFKNKILFSPTGKGLWWFDPVAGTARAAGVTAPTSGSGDPTGAAGAAGVLTGTYKLVYTYVNDQGHESNPSDPSAGVTVTAKKIDWSGIDVGPTGTSARKLYRTVANGEIYLHVATISDNTTTTYTDNIPDTELGPEVETNHTTPPATIRQIVEHTNRVWLIDYSDGVTLHACKADPITGDPDWEHYPHTIKVPASGGLDQCYAAWSLNNLLYIATLNRIFVFDGDPSIGFEIRRVFDYGIFGPFSWEMVKGGVVFFTMSRKIMLWNGTDPPEEISTPDVGSVLTGVAIASEPSHATFTYDDSLNQIWFSYATTTSQPNVSALVYDLKSKAWSKVDNAVAILMYHDWDRVVYGSNGNTLVSLTTYKLGSSYYTTQSFTTYPLILSYSKKLYIARVGITAKALPISSNVPPMLKVEYALNGSNDWISNWIDLTRDYLGVGNSGVIGVLGYVPVFQNARSIALRISPPPNAASVTSGSVVYDIFAEVDIEEPQVGDKRPSGEL